jgi:predicted glutamine amidotransferase
LIASRDGDTVADREKGGLKFLYAVASVPLTLDAGWRALGEGELIVARKGCAIPFAESTI